MTNTTKQLLFERIIRLMEAEKEKTNDIMKHNKPEKKGAEFIEAWQIDLENIQNQIKFYKEHLFSE